MKKLLLVFGVALLMSACCNGSSTESSTDSTDSVVVDSVAVDSTVQL
jgi:uncharacterized protein YcfL